MGMTQEQADEAKRVDLYRTDLMEKERLRPKIEENRIPAKPKNMTKFLYLTKSLILRGAELRPTKGWKTHRVKNIAESLKGLEFDYETLLVELQKRHGQVIFSETSNPMVGMK